MKLGNQTFLKLIEYLKPNQKPGKTKILKSNMMQKELIFGRGVFLVRLMTVNSVWKRIGMTANIWPNKRAKENIQDLLTNQTKANGYIKVYIVHYSLQQLAFEQIGPTWLSTISTGINLFLQLEYNPSIRKLGSVASFGKYVVYLICLQCMERLYVVSVRLLTGWTKVQSLTQTFG